MRDERGSWASRASADLSVEEALAHIDTGRPLVVTSDRSGAQQDLLLLSATGAVLAFFFLGVLAPQANHPVLVGVLGGIAALSIIGGFAVNMRMIRPRRLTLSTVGIVQEELVRGTWRREYAYRWYEISQVTVGRIGRSNKRICRLSVPAVPGRKAAGIRVPYIAFGENPERAWAVIAQAHRRYLEFSRREAVL
ncbi:hypothetical protein [Propionibacterium australiense]|uniref:Bacterial PH domain n=1 Tax=Propionibacterium australiense TaxID=119981 RepID=A0A383S756_9ACTN|nr:hypothetical protein [Propionibacterium australiense]RLP07691.1 hypothetical protein D7U36_10890 [Propionibacterium australiense]RLP08118.1 hypothetical protein D9T14_09530 [Propionibacterium australiense]SYZ33673.1 Hypothetical protein PROPAUS_1593 [Propionibacterium australiense]VEH92963.1 Uncharacterised protein [Propionibacterium australiense]